jgi:hypothetical protein
LLCRAALLPIEPLLTTSLIPLALLFLEWLSGIAMLSARSPLAAAWFSWLSKRALRFLW